MLVQEKALLPLAYKIKEYLPEKSEQYLCFQEVASQTQVLGRQDGTSTSSSQAELTSKKSPRPPDSIEIFLSFVTQDKNSKENLAVHLNVLQRQYQTNYGLNITITHKDNIIAGREWHKEIEQFLAKAHIILLLVSIDFLNSEFCTKVEMKYALQRHDAKEARVIPIILDSCPWRNEVFRDLKPLPEEGKPVESWGKRKQAFANIARGIEMAIKELTGCS